MARGLKLTFPEACALVAHVVLEKARDGSCTVADLMREGRTMLGVNQTLPGVASLLDEVQVEATFPDGTKLVTVHSPVSLENGDLSLALYGSFLPIPNLSLFPSSPPPSTYIRRVSSSPTPALPLSSTKPRRPSCARSSTRPTVPFKSVRTITLWRPTPTCRSVAAQPTAGG